MDGRCWNGEAGLVVMDEAEACTTCMSPWVPEETDVCDCLCVSSQFPVFSQCVCEG